MRNEYLLKLAHSIDAYRDVAWKVSSVAGTVRNILSHNFDKIPEDTRNQLLLILAHSIDAYRDVAWAVSCVGEAVAEAVCHNFDKLPENVRNELQKRLGKYGYKIYKIG